MNDPTLIVIAGCNGSGKSSFSNALTPGHITPFDYDKVFLETYKSLISFELQATMAHNMARRKLEESTERSIAEQMDFCYETNFDSTPMYWPDHFKEQGYKRKMIFFCLDSFEEAKRRVSIRVENGGHHVPDNEIQRRFTAGYQNLDRYYAQFDAIHLLNSSFYDQEPQHIMSLSNGMVNTVSEIPEFLGNVLPKISKLVRH